MDINIHGSKIEITPAIKEYIENKVGRIQKYFDVSDIKANVVCKISGINQIVEVTIPTKKMTLRAEVASKDLYDAIDKVSDKLERQIRKNKTRMKNKKLKDRSNMDTFNLDFDSDIDVEQKIVKRKVMNMKPMDEEEAILQMELIDHEFFVFKNIETDEVNVLYKRKDGNYGTIEIK